ncbi:hypothetical protein FEM48_Zijuj07G0092100 [Ziziphus jujuba var. spinosa]|uniref:Uncharacterized protein n=1 Tax=Ziziphus jujuba var. spinosa TaxID=714518 RepID=A0A978V3S3_ZIZJJ|nr:hypothetical protein FEM48_Zijuj07G0092100 [Ziziphus jujuba var. spinosa]
MKYLKELDLSHSQKLEKLPEIPEDCTSSSLGYLNITGCARLKTIPELPPCLSHIDAGCCASLETISRWTWRTPTAKEEKRYVYNFSLCLKLDSNSGNDEIADHRETLVAQDVDVKGSGCICSTKAETRFELNFKTNYINSDDDRVYKYDGGWLPHIGSKDEDHVLIRCNGLVWNVHLGQSGPLFVATSPKFLSVCLSMKKMSNGDQKVLV